MRAAGKVGKQEAERGFVLSLSQRFVLHTGLG